MRKIQCLALVLLLLFSSASCSFIGVRNEDHLSLGVGLLTDGNSVEDDGINQEIWACLLQMKKEVPGFETHYRIPRQDGGYSECAAVLAERGCSLIICVDGSMADTIAKVAQENPQCTFVVMDSTDLAQNNVVCLRYAMEDALYLAGYVAGKVSVSERLGCIHGRMTPETERLLVSYMAGARAANSDIDLLRKNILTQIDKGRLVAEEMVANGVDILFHIDGTEESPVIQVCNENGIGAVTLNAKQGTQNSDTVIVYAQKHVETVIRQLVNDAANGELKAGNRTFDFSNGGIRLTVNDSVVSEKLSASITNVRERIAAHEIAIPATFEALTEKYPDLAENP